MVKFRCRRSGNFVAFSDPNDIESMRKNESYEEIKHEAKETVKADENANEIPNEEKVLKKRGRPAKSKGLQ